MSINPNFAVLGQNHSRSIITASETGPTDRTAKHW